MHEVVAFYFLSLFIWFGSCFCCCCCPPILLTYHSVATNVYRCACARAHFTFFIILFIIIIHTFILSTIPWNPIGSYNLFSYMCIIQYRWMYGNAMREKKEYRAVRWANKTAHTHTHTHRNQFFFSGFSTCFYLTCALSFHFQASNATPKGERNEDQQQKQGVDRMLYIARCMVERAHFMSVVLIFGFVHNW